MKRSSLLVCVLAIVAPGLDGGARRALAQDVAVPILVLEEEEAQVVAGDAGLDLVNIVQTAAKSVTTVQEAPAIVTVITAGEIADRNLTMLRDVFALVPGWSYVGAIHNQMPFVAARGTPQGYVYLRDGLPIIDHNANMPVMPRGRVVPVEIVKRVEIITGPGGVLWGANSFLGIANVITKDAEDVDGVEAGLGWGDGDGGLDVYRGYVMAGLPRLGSDKVKLFAHLSFERAEGPHFEMPSFLYHSPQPQPNSLFIYGRRQWSDTPPSSVLNFDGKLTLGSLTLSWALPWSQQYYGLGFAGSVMREHLPEDAVCAPTGDAESPETWSTTDACIDRNRLGRKNGYQWQERYAMLDWRARTQGRRAGVAAKAYFLQTVRRWDPLQIFVPVKGLFEGGVGFHADVTSYRTGGMLDGDLELSDRFRILYGVEGVYEWLPDNTRRSRQGAGVEAVFETPYDISRLPFACPWNARWDADASRIDPSSLSRVPDCPVTFAFAADRTVLAGYTDLQLRLWPGLTLDGGARVQGAPATLSSRPYDPQFLGAGALVWQMVPGWHLKLNYTQGFRPPIFNNTDSNGEAVQLKGSPDLRPEKSQAYQVEVNARLLRNQRRLRSLDVRADYSYTILDDIIQFPMGQYVNMGRRGIHSAELLAKLYLKGEARFELGYTWLRIATADLGFYRAWPEHWFHVSGIVPLVRRRLEASATVRVLGAFEDPNRRADVDGLAAAPLDQPSLDLSRGEVIQVQPYEVVLDRIAPSAELQVGARYRSRSDRFELSATAYNALDGLSYNMDELGAYSPRLQLLPNPRELFRFLVQASYVY